MTTAAAKKKPILEFDPAGVPAELRALPYWVVWRSDYVPSRDDWAKVPYDPRSKGKADTTDSATWGTYDQALRCYNNSILRHKITPAHQPFNGIGFVFQGDYVGVDLDKCINNGTVEPWAQEIIDSLATFHETSPSGTGVKLWCKGVIPENGRRKGNVEIYTRNRYFTVTGHKPPTSPDTIRECNGELTQLWNRFFPPEKKPIHAKGTPSAAAGTVFLPSDDDVRGKAASARMPPSTFRLWVGTSARVRQR